MIRHSVLMLALAVCSCRGSDKEEIMLGGDRFFVPKHRVVEAEVSFLPSMRDSEFIFEIIPSNGEQGKIVVAVGDETPPCGNNSNGKCVDEIEGSPSRYVKTDVVAGGKQWNYTTKDRPGQIVASCYQATEPPGRCLLYGRFSSATYSFWISEDQITQISMMSNEIERQLEEWRVE